MVRRVFVITVFVVLALACAAVPAVALLGGAGATVAPASVSAEADTTITFDASATLVKYGGVVIVDGYLTQGGEPLSGSPVTIRATRDGVTRDVGKATTDDEGFYKTTLTPRSNASWDASAAGAVSAQLVIQVAPKVSLALSHLKPRGTRLTEIFRGSVKPAHGGKKVLVQKAVGGSWKTVARGKLDRRSHYRIVWRLPYKTATYKLRTILPAHADHAQGTSTTAKLGVVIRKG